MTMSSSINLLKYLLLFLILFAGGKNYAQDAQGVDASGKCYGRTLLGPTLTMQNPNGLQIILSGAGNMQVVKKVTASDGSLKSISGNMFQPDKMLTGGTESPFLTPGFFSYDVILTGNPHGLVVSIGDTFYNGGTFMPIGNTPLTNGGRFNPQSQTCQNQINSLSVGQTNEFKFKVTKNNLDYNFTVKYVYNYPETKFDVIYSVEIPQGNTEVVKLAHGWDSYFAGNDNGTGFYKPGSHPVVGTKRTGDYTNGNAYMGIRYNSGIPWSGYYADKQIPLFDAIRNDIVLNNSLAAQPTDVGIGISMNFGSKPGTYSTSTTQVYECPAGDIKPNINPSGMVCNATTVNLYNYITTSIPTNTRAVFLKITNINDTTGTVISNPENYNQGTPGDHYFKVYFMSDEFQCESLLSNAITINFSTSAALCSKCYSNPLTTGTVVKPVTGISNLVKTTTAKTWLDNFSGAQLVTESKTNGFVLNRLTTAQITALQNPVEGMVVYDTTTNELKVYNTATSTGANGVPVSTTGWKVFKNQYCPN